DPEPVKFPPFAHVAAIALPTLDTNSVPVTDTPTASELVLMILQRPAVMLHVPAAILTNCDELPKNCTFITDAALVLDEVHAADAPLVRFPLTASVAVPAAPPLPAKSMVPPV